MPYRKMEFSRRALLAGVGAAALLTMTPLTAWAQDPKRGGVLRYATLGLDSADPHRQTGSVAVQQIYVEALTSIASDGSVEPFLAESFEISEDGKTYTFKLRPGMTFHNGDAVTAVDVIANFERVKGIPDGGWLATAMSLVSGTEARGDDTVVLTLSEPYAPFLNLISELWILSPKSEGWDSSITVPIGTGPFKFGEWVPNVRLVAPRHEGYWREELPYLEAVEADLRGDTDKSYALRTGELHIAQVKPDMLDQFEADPNITVEPIKDARWYFIAFNNRSPRPPFDDIRVRQAISYAIDKTAFMNFVAGQFGVVANQPVTPDSIYFDAALNEADTHAQPDLERAKQLLDEAGVDPASITIELISWQENYPQVAVQMVRQLGFQINHVALDDLGAQNRLGQYDWDLAVMSSGPRADIFLRYVRLMSDGPNPVLWGGIQDPELDRLVNEAVATVPLEDRRALYLAAWQRVIDNYYTVGLGHAPELIGIRREVNGYEPGFTWSPNWASGGIAQTWLDT
jgi:peptide/nickel transport system substrate-binding protein